MLKAIHPVSYRIAFFSTLLVLLAGCSSGGGRWSRADYELRTGKLSEVSASEPLSTRIYLLGDNQRHELLGDGVRIFQTSLSDELTQVAIRPPQLDLFGQDLLREALAMADGFVLHLGDACNISNTGEFAHFAWDMRQAKQGWVMAPGNHDGYFFGNSSRVLKNLVREWDESAETYEFDGTQIDSRALQKDRYVSFYLASLILQDAVWSAPLASQLGSEIENRFEKWRTELHGSSDSLSFATYWSELDAMQELIYQLESPGTEEEDGAFTFELPAGLDTGGQPHLRRIGWRIAKTLTWRSFVVQEVDISAAPVESGSTAHKNSILVLDTSQYAVQPSIEAGVVSKVGSAVSRGFFDEQMAGLTGSFLPIQVDIAADFGQSMKQEGRRWLLASHHPYRDLGRRAKTRFDRLRETSGIPTTLSAHSIAARFAGIGTSRMKATGWRSTPARSLMHPSNFATFSSSEWANESRSRASSS